MKTIINQAVFNKSKSKIGEIFLFSEMAKSLNNFVPAVYVNETHGRKGWVQFQSNLTQTNAQKEISDLMIICVNRPTKEIKISFLQAKYHKTKTIPFLIFYGDYLQLELLSKRPDINPNNFYRFPPNILNFSKYRSLTNFGVFFHDSSGEIDMLYSVADLLGSKSTTALKGPVIFPGNSDCPRVNCFTDSSIEMISTCNIDLFEKGLINFQIGAPINTHPVIYGYVKSLFQAILNNPNLDRDREILNIILDDNISDNIASDYSNVRMEGHPSVLIIQTYRGLKE